MENNILRYKAVIETQYGLGKIEKWYLKIYKKAFCLLIL
jgi:hypothetical protein